MPIIDAPEALKRSRIVLASWDSVAHNLSPYSRAGDRIDFGGEAWSLTVTTPPLIGQDAAAVSAWCRRLRAPDAFARLSPREDRYGTSTSSILRVRAATPVLSRSFPVNGIGAGDTVLAGSLVEISGRLYSVMEDLTGDVNGEATMSVWPRTRDALAFNAPITMDSPSGQWVLREIPDIVRDARISRDVREPMEISFVEMV